MKTFALVAVLCLALASAYPYEYNNYNNYNSRYMGMGQYYNNPYQYQYGGMSGYNMMGRGGYMGYDNYRYPYMNQRNYGGYLPYSGSSYRSSRYGY